MAQIYYKVIHAIVAALVKVGFSKATALLISRLAVQFAITAAAAALMRALTPVPRGMNQGQQLQIKQDPAYGREVAVGVAATGGSVVYENTQGDENRYWWRVIALSDCEIKGVLSVLGNGEALTFSGDIHTGFRECTSHYQSAGGQNMLKVRVYKGTQTQTADPDLIAAFPSDLDSNFRGKGVAYAIIRMQASADAWPASLDFVWVIEGALCEDPRDDSVAWTDNPVLIGRQFLKGFTNNGYLMVGMGVDDADLPDADYEQGADECDELVALKGGGTEKRYRMGGMINARESPREILSHICAAMAGKHIDRGGEIILQPGVWRAPIRDVSESEILADTPLAFAARRTADERANAVVSSFVNPADGYQEAPLPPRKDAAAITADGQRFETVAAYRFVYSRTQGQRLDAIKLKRARKEGFLSYSAPLWAFEFSPGDTHTMTNRRWMGVQKYWELEALELAITSGAITGQPSARCALTLRETGPDVYDWDETTEELDAAATATPTYPAMPTPRFDDEGRVAGSVAAGNPTLTGASGVRSPSQPLSAADVGSTATISIASYTLQTSDGPNGGSRSVSYNSGSVTGASFSTAYYVWAYDPFLDGGAVTYVASTSASTYLTDARYVYVGYITTPADGGGGTSPPPPPPDQCVAEDAWIDAERHAGEIEAGAEIEVLAEDMSGPAQATVESAHSAIQRGVRLVSTSGVSLSCSESTPLTQRSGNTVRAHAALGAEVAVRDSAGFRWERIARVERIGLIRVRRIHIGGRTYAAGDQPDRLMFTHNPLK